MKFLIEDNGTNRLESLTVSTLNSAIIYLNDCQRQVQREIDRRNIPEELKYGYEVNIYDESGYLTAGVYRCFDTFGEAVDNCVKELNVDNDTAGYQLVRKVYM